MATSALRAATLFVKHARRPDLWRHLAGLGVAAERERLVPRRTFLDLYPEASDVAVPVGDVQFRAQNMDPYEIYCLSALALLRTPRVIFEFGTFDGATTLRLARLLPEAQLFTVDLPDERSEVTARAQGDSPGSGYLFRPTPQARQITQIYGDSREIDFTPWYGQIDLVIIDAGHSYDCVSADTDAALRLASPTGIVIWDDYSRLWPDVVRAVDEVAASGRAKPVILGEMALWDRARRA